MTVPVRVVVVDDQPLARAGNALILDSDDGIEVVGEAGTGFEALEVVARELPDVVLMDVRMPVMDGLEATRILTERHPGTRIIVLTTFDLDEYAFGSLRAGASAFLLKSTKPAALVDAVHTVADGAAVAAPRLTAQLIEHFVGQKQEQRQGQRQGQTLSREGQRGVADPRQADRAADPSSDPLGALSPRERDVFAGIVAGQTNAEIAEALFLAPSTVKSHVNQIFAKLQLRDRVHAVILGYELGLADREGSENREAEPGGEGGRGEPSRP
ncbi:response regulator [Leucobacter albus]|uniref:Response regulator n=1 Tax=Leucobacter albus TaxID=272210 RepID=A0ABW3TN16_9MICO